MQFHTELSPEIQPHRLGLDSRIVTLGSCFAEVMGKRLSDHKLTVLNNPFGTLFNPVSMTKLVTMALFDKLPDENLYVERDGIWFHYDFHSTLWANSQDELRQKLIDCLAQTNEALRQADFLFLTFGSAVVYRHIETGKVVANCHKMPGALFEKYLYQIDHLRDEVTRLVKTLHRVNPTLTIITTVSPVRHTRDTLSLNSVSKSMLRVLMHELTAWYDWVSYFPAFELMVDDLRDYRFYESDLIHPNAQAHDYIFDKLAETAFDSELHTFLLEWSQIRKSLAHRPHYGEQSPSYQQFLRKLLIQLNDLSGRIDVSAELADVQGRLPKQGVEERQKEEREFS